MRALRHIAVATLALVGMLGVIALSLGSAQAQTFPALSGRVVDAAGVLDPSIRAGLVARLAALEAQSTDQLVIATVKSLQGETVEDYALQLFREWRLGQKGKNNGVLLLVAPTERKVRIEVGYGLEGTLTDAVAKLIIAQTIVPRFRANDFAGGIVQGTDDIVGVLTGDALAWQRRAAAVSAPKAPAPIRYGGTAPPDWADYLIIGLFGVLALVVIVLFGLLFLVLLTAFLVWLGVLPAQKDRHGAWLWLNRLNRDPEPDRLPLRSHERRSSQSSEPAYASSSSSSGSSDSFSGGGGSSGGGGASGSW